MHRALVTKVGPRRVSLDPGEAHHLTRVRRARIGQSFVGLDGCGGVYICRLRKDGDAWIGEIEEERAEDRESPLRLVLAQALLKRDRFEWAVQKATELGVAAIVPLITERTEVRPRSTGERRREKRLRRIVDDAFKQSHRTHLPEIRPAVGLKDFLEHDRTEACLVLDEKAKLPLTQALKQLERPPRCAVLIGPEGGWDDRDRKLFVPDRCLPVRIGPRILRAETAPIAALSILQAHWGDW